MQGTERPSLPSKPRQREALILAALAVTALVIVWSLTAGGAALAGPLGQDSPVAPPQEQLSPLPTAAPAVEPARPAPTTTPASEPQPAIPATAQPPIPIGVLIAVMAVIGLAALIIGLRRR